LNQQPRPRPSAPSRRRRRRKPNVSLFLARAAVAAVLALLMLGVLSAVFFLFVLPGRSGGESEESTSASVQQEPLASSAADAPLETVPVETIPGYTSKPDFLSDLDDYEMYMNPEGDEYLLLVNSESTLDASHVPDDLTDLADTRKDGRNTQQMRLYAAKALEAMFIELRACGYTDVSVTSAYRAYSYQSYLFNMYTDQEMSRNPSLTRAQAEAITETYSARPGTSEHQTGLCCDMHNLGSADVAFAKQKAAVWLKENAHKFGFILRYPEDKTEITGISFEPWHFRYVGRQHATAIYEAGLCLEEYILQRKGG